MLARMRESVAYSAQVYASDDAVRVTISIGVAATSTGQATTLDALVQAADRALFDAKRAGRNQVWLAPQRHPGLANGPALAG